MNYLDVFLFAVFPYVAFAIFIVGTIYRYKCSGFKFSSLSCQFIEGRASFWGVVPFHVGILVLFLGHLNVFLFPDLVVAWNRNPNRLIFHEGFAFTFGLSVFFAMVFLLYRRFVNPRLRVVSTKMDFAIELVLLTQIVLGCWIALGYRWGSSWFAADLTPYLRSLFALNPQIEAVVALPIVIKLHVLAAFCILLLIPFSRLVHFLVVPLHYIGRPYQLVRWNWDKKKIRKSSTPWQRSRPKNN